jgi:3-oxoacyl-[acyl-carrier-protein] synthase-3
VYFDEAVSSPCSRYVGQLYLLRFDFLERTLKKVGLAKLSAVGTYVPPGLLTNEDLEKLVETSDQWIVDRTGIRSRHIVDKGVASSDLATEAVKQVLERSGVRPRDIELIIVATITPDMVLPATACIVQHNIGAIGAWGFDLNVACSGFLYAMQVGAQFVVSGAQKNALIIGVDVMSTIVDYTDRQTCVIFGDGAGAALIQRADPDDDCGIIDYLFEIDGSGGPSLCIPGGGSRYPASHETIDKRMHFVKQDGQAVFKFATRKIAEVCEKLLQRNGYTGHDVDVFIPHQANRRIIAAAAERMQLDMDRVIINIEEYGNTTAATIPIAMQTAIEQGKLKRGDLVLVAAVGAGFSAGAALLRWAF